MHQKKYQSVASVLTCLFLGGTPGVAGASTEGEGEKMSAAMQAPTTEARQRPRSASQKHRKPDPSAPGSTAPTKKAPSTTAGAVTGVRPPAARKRSASSKATATATTSATAPLQEETHQGAAASKLATSRTPSPANSRASSPGKVPDLLQKVQAALQPQAPTTMAPPVTPSPGKPPASRRVSRDGKHHPRQSIFSEAFPGWVGAHTPKTVEDAWRAGLLGQPHEYATSPHNLVTAAQKGPLNEEHHIAATYHLAHALRQLFNKGFKLTGTDFVVVQHLFHFSRALAHIHGAEVRTDAARAEDEIRKHNPFLGILMETWTQIRQGVQQATSE